MKGAQLVSDIKSSISELLDSAFQPTKAERQEELELCVASTTVQERTDRLGRT